MSFRMMHRIQRMQRALLLSIKPFSTGTWSATGPSAPGKALRQAGDRRWGAALAGPEGCMRRRVAGSRQGTSSAAGP